MDTTKPKDPVTFILFGATGDLALGKIFPALESLFKAGVFSKGVEIIAVSRREWDDAKFRSFLVDSVRKPYDARFLERISYSKVDIDHDSGYEELKRKIDAFESGHGGCSVLAYLSLAPRHHGHVVSSLVRAGILSRGCGRLLIEKPFGTDEKTARALDKRILSLLDEKQIFRIDHYLGKDALRAMMDLHERTPAFDSILSKESVASIRIRFFETKGIEARGKTYDDVGAFRDVGQNHMLEMLGIVAAQIEGEKGNGDMWQKARAKVFALLAPPSRTCELSRRGQYVEYRSESGVKEGSATETAFEIVTTLSGGKLQGVPISLESGKRMDVSEVLIEIAFKDIDDMPKRMIFNVQPEQEIVTEYADGKRERFMIPRRGDAYENVILAALVGSRREFVGSTEIESLWAYADHVVACWDKIPLELYGQGRPFLIK